MNLKNVNRKANIRVNVILAGDEEEKGARNLFKKIISEGSLNLGNKLDIQVHQAYRISYYHNAKNKIISKTHYNETVTNLTAKKEN